MSERLIYLPLGGAGEIGMNAYVYGYGQEGRERLILVDLGVGFPDMDSSPGVDLIFPDISWLIKRRDQLEAIFITHAHEDHVGAVARFWDQLQVPVYARSFTAHIARLKFGDQGLEDNTVHTASPWPEKVHAGPFQVGFLPLSHSIPESSGLVIDTPAGRMVHTGDFKLDKEPGVGEPFDPDLWKEVAKPGIHALVCDSTNVFSRNPGKSEASLPSEIEPLVSACKGMFVATTFASNVARVKTLAQAGAKAGRSVCLMGRAMQRMIQASVETGVLTDFPKTIRVEDLGDVPRENTMLIVTGSQGERRAASAQLAQGKYRGISLKPGDTFLFSSKTIPGNETSVARIMNQLAEQDIDVIDEQAAHVHVSGHANRPDLERIHKLLKPKGIVPMHGERRHLREHVKLARSNGFQAGLAPNGTMLDLTQTPFKVADHIETGRVYLDGHRHIGALDGVVRDRIRMARNGLVIVNVILDNDDDPLGDPWCVLRGLPDDAASNAALEEILEEDINQFLGRAESRTMTDDDRLDEEITRIVRKTAQDEIGKRPEVSLIISRMA